jgi:hypothetical protein
LHGGSIAAQASPWAWLINWRWLFCLKSSDRHVSWQPLH